MLATTRPAPGTPRVLAVLAALLITLGSVGACSSEHSRYPCSSACTGTIEGARYSIRVPSKWNGTLVLFSHGYASVAGANHPALSPNDPTGAGTDALSGALLAKGYALAGSGTAQIGWDVAIALQDNERLYRHFVTEVARPKRVIAWGQSLGGLITELMAERDTWVNGAAALCGVVAGPVHNADLITRAGILVGRLTGEDLSANGSQSVVKLGQNTTAAVAKMKQMATGSDADKAALVATAAQLGTPVRSFYTTAAQAPGPAAAAENLGYLITVSTTIAADMTQRFGANYGSPDLAGITAPPAASASVISGLGASAATLTAQARALTAPATDADSRANLASSGTPTGRLRVPLLTVHDEYDPVAYLANERVLADAVDAAGKSALLKQTFVVPNTDAALPSYGIGHCIFSDQQWTGSVEAVDRWVTSGTAPTDATLDATLGKGLDTELKPPAWPVG